MLRPIALKELLQAPNGKRDLDFRQSIADFESLTAVQGSVSVAHRGTFIEVFGSFQTIVTLCCHRCLQTYNHRLQAEPSEVLWLESAETAAVTAETAGLEDLVETLPAEGEFDVEDWIYQQLCLALPQRQLCAEDCAGLTAHLEEATVTDRRWDALQKLKQNLL